MLDFNQEWSATITLVGLGCNAIGACILTLTAWRALQTGGALPSAGAEWDAKKCRANVANGGGLLVAGFVLQFLAAWPL